MADIKVIGKVVGTLSVVTLASTYRVLHAGGDGGDAKDKRGIAARWEKVRDALGFGSGASQHACRHTTGTRLALAKVPPKSIQKFMRHTSETVTLIYVNLGEDAGHGAVEVLEARTKRVT